MKSVLLRHVYDSDKQEGEYGSGKPRPPIANEAHCPFISRNVREEDRPRCRTKDSRASFRMTAGGTFASLNKRHKLDSFLKCSGISKKIFQNENICSMWSAREMTVNDRWSQQ